MSEIIKAVSLWQPWASLWLSPNKRHETRHWATPHRGKLLVHAAKKFVRNVDGDLDDILSSEFGRLWGMDVLPTGAIIGMVDLLDVIPTAKVFPPNQPVPDTEFSDYVCGDFSEGRFGWRRGTYWVFREPVPWKGRQSIFSVPTSAVADALRNAREVIGG